MIESITNKGNGVSHIDNCGNKGRWPTNWSNMSARGPRTPGLQPRSLSINPGTESRTNTAARRRPNSLTSLSHPCALWVVVAHAVRAVHVAHVARVVHAVRVSHAGPCKPLQRPKRLAGAAFFDWLAPPGLPSRWRVLHVPQKSVKHKIQI